MESDKIFSFGKIRILQNDDYPNRPTIIFLHDSLGCIELWREFPQRLGELVQCNTFIYDRLGYGKSAPFTSPKRNTDYMEIEADRLSEILEKCSIDKAVLFGHSDGGSIALLAASEYPEQISGIITEGAHVFVEDITLNGIKQAVNTYQTTHLKQKLEKYHGDKTEALFWAWAETWQTSEYKHWNIERFLPHIQCPAFIIQGENDEYGSSEQVNAITDQVKGFAKKWMIPNVGHTPHKELPEQVLHQSFEFIQSTVLKLSNDTGDF